jgi:hypothetical protein
MKQLLIMSIGLFLVSAASTGNMTLFDDPESSVHTHSIKPNDNPLRDYSSPTYIYDRHGTGYRPRVPHDSPRND